MKRRNFEAFGLALAIGVMMFIAASVLSSSVEFGIATGVVVTIALTIIFAHRLNKNVPEDVQKLYKIKKEDNIKEKLEFNNMITSGSKFNRVLYERGYIGLDQRQYTTLIITSDKLALYNLAQRKLFEIDTDNIISVEYDTAEKVSAMRSIMLGVGSLLFPKKDYIIIITYLHNQFENNLVLNTNSQTINNELYNAINSLRQKSKSETTNHKTTTSVSRETENLYKLKSEGVLTEEEFIKAKETLLSRY